MSRIGKLPISIPANVTVTVSNDNVVTVKGPKGELSQAIDASIAVVVEDGPQGTIKIALKYDAVNKVNAIKNLVRVSSPGLRRYTGYKDMPRVINGLGIAILSTSKGVMTDKEAATEKIGGEVLCYVY